MIRRQGYALIAALGLVMAALLVRGLPINALLRLTASTTKSADVLGPVGGLLAIGAVILVAGSLATQFITTHKD